jgi:hypothetical protein
MIMMTLENTAGYVQSELDELNAEFDRRFQGGDWPTDNREEAEKWFADEVSHRQGGLDLGHSGCSETGMAVHAVRG